MQAVVELGEKADDGFIIQAVTLPWFAIVEALERDPGIRASRTQAQGDSPELAAVDVWDSRPPSTRGRAPVACSGVAIAALAHRREVPRPTAKQRALRRTVNKVPAEAMYKAAFSTCWHCFRAFGCCNLVTGVSEVDLESQVIFPVSRSVRRARCREL
jgi:hypothetical protein